MSGKRHLTDEYLREWEETLADGTVTAVPPRTARALLAEIRLLREEAGARIVEYRGDADMFTFFHEDGLIPVPGGEVVTAYMRARDVVEVWRRVRFATNHDELAKALVKLEVALTPIGGSR